MHLIRFYIFFFGEWLKFYFRAKTRYEIHSPYVSRFVEEVVEDDRTFYAFPIIDNLRQALKRNQQQIRVTDLGAGSKLNNKPIRKIGTIARNAAVSSSEGERLFRLVHFCKPNTMLELGTSLGISTLYQAGAAMEAQFVTLEGCPETAKVAQMNIQRMGMPNIRIEIGDFKELLPQVLPLIKKLDYFYLDGNHQEQPVLDYFEKALPYLHTKSIVVIADNHWSIGMKRAWQKLKEHPDVTMSIDLFDFGVLFFDDAFVEKQHYSLIKAWKKPWRMGFWSRSNK